MDQVMLRESAEYLEEVISKYASDAKVGCLHKALSTLIADARAGTIVFPLQWNDIPGTYAFIEGGLQQYRDLETAYAKFKIEITGGESPLMKSLRLNQRMRDEE